MAALLTGLAGCASGGSPAPTSTSAGTASASASASMPMESSSTMPSTTQGMPGSAAAAITIKDFAFGNPLTVSPGATVTVTNQDTAEHTVTADQGQAFDVEVKGGGTATFTAPSQPGTYEFHCTYHPNMHGTLTVK
ncbi:cupredoxin domain-containing protein [Arthrobacter sp. YAF17]|uniref:cupredoxin domain-containing protein n=1 Tax=Arthrobacter sp. YAF17 TaxID=3233077 RepID=UPI003F901910